MHVSPENVIGTHYVNSKLHSNVVFFHSQRDRELLVSMREFVHLCYRVTYCTVVTTVLHYLLRYFGHGVKPDDSHHANE